MQLVLEILYMILLFVASYYISFHLVYWFENRDKFRQRPKPIKDKELPKISLIVPAYNEEDIIVETIEKLKKINYPKDKLEIIVVDDGSKDRTYEIAKKFESEQIKVFTKPNSGKASTLNFGIEKTKNEFVGVMDADTYMEKNALRECMKYFNEEGVAAVVSHILVSRKTTFWEKMQSIETMVIAFTRKAEEFPNVIRATPGPLAIYRKEVLVKLKGFDEKVLVEDVEIAWNILSRGYKIRMAFDAVVYSFYPSTFKKWWRTRIRWSIGGIQNLMKYFHTLGKKTYGVGGFLVPMEGIGYFSAFTAIGIFLYLLTIRIFNFFTYVSRALSFNLNPFARWELAFNPNIEIIYGLMVFLLTLCWLWVALRQHKWNFNFLNLLCFITIYSFIFPFISIIGAYKYFKGERGWLTK
jgi:cellulose synthase/poly-beta-1,6-N-acetylglucosamine synthase-like glycosyltransferase